MTDGDAIRERRDTLLIAAFLAALAAPGVAMVARGPQSANASGEDVRPLVLPEANVRSVLRFPLEAQAYFNENFGLRAELIRGMSLLKLRLFRVPANREV